MRLVIRRGGLGGTAAINATQSMSA
jgi:hypothetical protein